MTSKDRELMAQYIYQVVRRLSKNQRHEVEMELEELISDMAEQGMGMEEVLTKLGDPKVFARQYQDDRHYLIGPEYYDNYVWLLKIVLLCAGGTILVVSVIETVTQGIVPGSTDAEKFALSIVYGIGSGFINLAASCISVFGIVTILFALMERGRIRFDRKADKEWKVSDLGSGSGSMKQEWSPGRLTSIPSKKAVISKGDSIIGIIFIVIFCVLLIFVPHFFSLIITSGEEMTMIPVFNLEQWQVILPVFVLSMALALADEVIRLAIGHYCRIVMISNLICGFLQIILAVVILRILPFWNPGFVKKLNMYMGEHAEFLAANLDVNMISNGFLALIMVITFAEMGVTVYKTMRYGMNK